MPPPCSTPGGWWAAPRRRLASAPAAESPHRPRQQPQMQALCRLSPGKRRCSAHAACSRPSPCTGARWSRGQAGLERTLPLAAAHGLSEAGPTTSASLGLAGCDQSLCPHLEAHVAECGADSCQARASWAEGGPGAPGPRTAGQAAPSHGGASRGGAQAGAPLPVGLEEGLGLHAVSCRSVAGGRVRLVLAPH